MFIFKNKKSRVWFIVSSIVLVLGIVINVVATGYLNELISILLADYGDPIYAEGSENQISYVSDYADKDDALEKSNALNVTFAEEGIVLLKNEGNALPIATPVSDKTLDATAKPKISVFGKNSVNLVLGGSGSGGVTADEYTKNIYDSLEAAGYDTNQELRNFYNDNSRSGNGRSANPDMNSGGVPGFATGETPVDRYDAAVSATFSEYNKAALVVFSRIGGEGADLPRTSVNNLDNMDDKVEGARNGDDHYLQLDQNETDLLAYVCNQNFEHVIVVINSAHAMELGFLDDPTHYAYQSKIDGAVWMGGPGKSGVMALGRILNGEVTPSGRTVDTYVRNLKEDPTWNNFGNNRVKDGDRYLNEKGRKAAAYFVDYEEGIYVGYRYYETRGFTDGEQWYKNHVVFPMGYGLSYADFDVELLDKAAMGTALDATKDFDINVKVTNTSSTYSGKWTVPVFATPAYKANGIEKAHKVLVGFEKTNTLAPGESETLTITVDPYYLASYDYSDANNNQFKGYELEDGEYEFYVAKNAHESYDSFTKNLSTSYKYTVDPVTEKPVGNLFDDVDDELGSVLSRTDWDGTWPATRTAEEMKFRDGFKEKLDSTDPHRPDNTYGALPTASAALPMAEEADDSSAEASEESSVEIEGIRLRDLVGAEFDDVRWEELLDKISFQEMVDMFSQGAFKTNPLLQIGKPRTNDSDGPVGWTNFMDPATYSKTCSYCGEVMLGCTWNKDIMYKFGESVGNEALVGYNGTPYTCWYAPAVNIHRSAFGGRNFEYFSEDGYFSGVMAAAEIAGARSKGVVTDLKHFALNEQETNRSTNGVCTWATEQSMREIYLRPFEIAVKYGKANGIMSSFNRIGTTWTGGDYRLITSLLREEWGFHGIVICDYNDGTPYMNCRQEIYAGGNVNLASRRDFYWNDANGSDARDVYVAREATHETLYAIANSNALNADILGYKQPRWITTLIIVDSVLGAGIIAWGALAILDALKKKAIA